MKYIPNTDSDIQEMLKDIGEKSFDSFISKIIPNELRPQEKLNIGSPFSEFDLINDINKIKSSNKNLINFDGGGVYDHYIPSVVDFISSRSEFYTSYTPYQAEVSQGTLQYLYEFQSMISEISGLEVSNASLYDGASALAEACSMAINITNKNKILLSSAINPNYLEVLKTYLSYRHVEIDFLEIKDGVTDINQNIDNFSEYACIAIQSPNYFGLLENWGLWSKKNNNETLLIAVSDPISLSMIKSPGESGADIYCGEGQSLGNYMNLGGPYLGLLSSKLKYIRKIPGRIIGKTEDLDGKDGYVLTLQAREQHIRRDKANSNICTNQSLLALRASIYLSLLGKNGILEIAKISFNKSQYAAKHISEIPGFLIPYGNSFIKEFVVETNLNRDKLIENALNENISISPLKNTQNQLLIAVTEKRTKAEIDRLVNFLKKQ
tara:strand:+ start:642 stop:1952 length:1311 start_codon:yes stop_codon:yes gene_type:complete